MKKIVIAEVLQNDVDKMLGHELQECDRVKPELGDAFLIQALDSIANLMSKRASLKQHAKKVESCASYFSQIYPPEFVKGLTADHTVSTPKKKQQKMDKPVNTKK